VIKKRLGKLLFVVITVWIVISIYFYFQHNVTVKVMEVPGWSLNNQKYQGLLVKEIRVYDWKPRRTEYWDRWFPVLSLGNKLPPTIRMKYFRIAGSILTFYTDPYQKLEEGVQRIEVIGLFLKRQPGELGPNDHPKVRVYSDGKLVAGISSGFGMQYSGNSNYYIFDVHDDMVNRPIKNSMEITWQWDDGPLVSESLTGTRFNTETYSFFKRPDLNYGSNLRPDRKALEFINNYKNGGEEKASNLLSTKVTGFPWKRLEWIKGKEDYSFSGDNYYGKYMGFQNVFTVDLALQKTNSEENYAEQIIYLVDDGSGWKVIDIGPRQSI